MKYYQGRFNNVRYMDECLLVPLPDPLDVGRSSVAWGAYMLLTGYLAGQLREQVYDPLNSKTF